MVLNENESGKGGEDGNKIDVLSKTFRVCLVVLGRTHDLVCLATLQL